MIRYLDIILIRFFYELNRAGYLPEAYEFGRNFIRIDLGVKNASFSRYFSFVLYGRPSGEFGFGFLNVYHGPWKGLYGP